MNTAHPVLHLGQPNAVYLSPSWEAFRARTGKDITWGYYQFPKLRRAPGGELYLRVNVGPDSQYGEDEEPVWFISRDSGATWHRTARDEVDLSPLSVTLPDGTQVCTGNRQHAQNDAGPHGGANKVYPARYHVQPVLGPFFHPYTQSELVAYRLNDLPEQARSFPLAYRESDSAEWTHTRAVLDVEEMLKVSAVRARRWWTGKEDDWVDMEPWFRAGRVCPSAVLPDGTLLATAMSQHADVADRTHLQVFCLQSADAGRRWTKRAVIAGDTELTTHGYAGENQLRIAPNGDLVCVVRTLCDLSPSASRWLGQCRSIDGGYSWSRPEKIAEFSVTPQLLVLENGAMIVGYGRPGVYLRTSADSARTWSASIAVHGPDEADVPDNADEWFNAHRKRYSCANISTAITGPDRFILAYSDFQYPHPDGGTCKAIVVREIVVTF